MNHISLMGRLVRDPELKTTQSGVSVVSFTVAVDRAYKPKDGEREVDFINCIAWRQTAEFVARWFSKGKMIAVSGNIQTRKYADKDGINHNVVEVVAENVYFCGDRGERIEAAEPRLSPLASDFEDIEDDDELPFIK